MANPVPSWTVPGVVTERRPLETKDKKSVWAYVVKIMAMGGLFEVQTKDRGLYDKFVEGAEVVASGRFESYNGRINLIALAVK